MAEKFAYSITETLKLVPFGRTLLYQEIAAGRLTARKAGRRTFIMAADLEKYLQNLPAITRRMDG